MTELDLFIDWAKNQDLDVTIVDFSGAIKLIDKNGKQRDFCFEEFETDIAWLSWQTATQREDELQKRIDKAIIELSKVSNMHVINAREILKGKQND